MYGWCSSHYITDVPTVTMACAGVSEKVRHHSPGPKTSIFPRFRALRCCPLFQIKSSLKGSIFQDVEEIPHNAPMHLLAIPDMEFLGIYRFNQMLRYV